MADMRFESCIVFTSLLLISLANLPDLSGEETRFYPACQLSSPGENFHTPDWVKNAIFYQIFLDRFRNGDPGNDPRTGDTGFERGDVVYSNWGHEGPAVIQKLDWDEPGLMSTVENEPDPWGLNWYGGDLQGVIEKAGYLENLGINAIYFNPIHDSTHNYGYTVIDYKSVNRYFGVNKRDENGNLVLDYEGSLEVFENMMEELDRRGIRVILDGVWNHCSAKHRWFDVDNEWPGPPGAFESQDSPFYSWFDFWNWPTEYETYGGGGFKPMPKIVDNPDFREYLFGGENSIIGFWDELGVDGWRLDHPQEQPHSFWKEFRTHYKQLNPDGFIVGEEWGYAGHWLQGDEWDSTMNYIFRGAVLDWANGGSVSGFDAVLNSIKDSYPSEAFYVLFNILDSHDTERALTTLGGDKSKMKLAVIFQMTYPGAPVIYYGDEIGMLGTRDPFCRNPYPWEDTGGDFIEISDGNMVPFEPDYDLFRHYQKLIGIRMKYPVLRTGSLETLKVDDDQNIYVLGRELDGTYAVVIYNNGKGKRYVDLDLCGFVPSGTVLYDVLNGNIPYRVEGEVTVPVDSRWASILISGARDILKYPRDAAQLSNNTVQLEWRSIAGAEGYRVLVDNDPDFSSPEENEFVFLSLHYKISELPDGLYYWKVIVTSASGENESEIQTFMIVSRPSPASSPTFFMALTVIIAVAIGTAIGYHFYHGIPKEEKIMRVKGPVKFCSSCGCKLKPGTKFCPRCGQPIKSKFDD